MNIVDTVVKLHRSLNDEQNNMLFQVADECKKLGATSKQLAPLYASITIGSGRKPSNKEIEYGKKLIEEDRLAGRYIRVCKERLQK